MSRPVLLRRSNNELKQMNDLNKRFVSFIQLVKSETLRSEELQQDLIEQKEKYFADFRQTNRDYLEKLNSVKKYLNDLCMNVCEDLVREKHNRVLADWYSKLAKFEQSLSSCGGSSGIGSTVVLNSSGYFETSSPCSNSYLNSSDFSNVFPNTLSEVTLVDPPTSTMTCAGVTGAGGCGTAAVVVSNLGTTASASQNLIDLSGISSSQSSLNSCSSYNFSISASSSTSSSSSSSSTSYSSDHSSIQSVMSHQHASTSPSTSTRCSPDHFSLEVYLNTLTKTRSQLSDDLDKKVFECTHLKQNIATLNNDLNNLNDNLDSVKIENIKMNDDIKNMRREIEFLRQLYSSSSSTSSSTSQSNQLSGGSVEALSLLGDDSRRSTVVGGGDVGCNEWMQREIEMARARISQEYEEFTSEQLGEYESELASEMMLELERIDVEYSSREARLENESEEILDELIDLNAQLTDDLKEFETLSRINTELNERLINLSSRLIEFNSLSKDKQERMIVNFSIASLKKENESRRILVKELKQELSVIKSQLIQNDAFDLILHENQSPESSQLLTLETSINNNNNSNINNNNDFIGYMSLSNSSSSRLDAASWTNRLLMLQQQELLLKEIDEIKCAFHIRPYCAQIEYTKSNLFAYFLIKFDIIYHNYAAPVINNNNNNNNNSNNSSNNNNNNNNNTSSLQSQSPSSSTSSVTTPKIAVTNNNSVNKNNCILNCLKIVYDSIDGHSILIENCHRILDIDLSEWTLKREIYQDAPIKSSRRSKPDFTVEYKFPKGFRLKRRKKINLIAAGKKTPDPTQQQQQQQQHSSPKQAASKLLHHSNKLSMSCNSLNNGGTVVEATNSSSVVKMRRPNATSSRLKPACSSLSLVRPQSQVIGVGGSMLAEKRGVEERPTAPPPKLKCSCCACQNLTTRKGDIEFFEIEEIANWGSGILVLTKLINTKNVIKMVNYRYLKHIWVNNDHHHEKQCANSWI